MANVEKFLFQVDANTKQASDALNGIIRLMNTIDKLNGKGVDNFYTTNQKDMDKAMRSMSDLVNGYEDFNGIIEELIASQEKLAKAPMPKMPVTPRKPKDGASEEQRKEYEARQKNAEAAKKQWEKDRKQAVDQRRTAERNIALLRQQQQLVKRGYKDTQLNYRHLASMEMNPSKNFKPHFKLSNSRYNFSQNTDEAKKQLETTLEEANQVNPEDVIKQQIKDTKNLLRRGATLKRRAVASNYMSTMEAASFYKDVRTARGFLDKNNGDIAENKKYMVSRGQQRKLLAEQVDTLKATEGNDQNLRDIRIEKEEEIRLIEKELDARAELDRVLKETADKMERYFSDVVDNKTEVKPQRGTTEGMIYERAPAIGLAIVNSLADTLNNLYRGGQNPSQAMRGPEVMIGQMTNSKDWRGNIRNYAQQQGLENGLGFTGTEMMGLESNYLTNSGYKGMKDMRAAMNNQATFARTEGLSSEDTSSFFSGLYSTGAVNGAQTKQIQDAFIGAIKRSGMEGREKEQLSALDDIVGSISQNRQVTNQEVMNVMGLQSLLSSSGNRSLQGAQGAQFLTSLDQGIKQGFQNPMMRLVFGEGTKYQGIAGRHELRQQMEKGITDVDNVSTLARTAQSYNPGNVEAQKESFISLIQEGLGADVKSQQTDEVYDAFLQGKLTQKTLNKILEEDKKKGKTTGDKKLKDYQNSLSSADNQSDATSQMLQAQLYDEFNWLRKINGGLGTLSKNIEQASNAFTYVIPLVYGAGAGIQHLVSFSIGSVLIPFMAGEFVRRLARGVMLSSGPETARYKISNFVTRMIPWGRGGGPPGGGPGGGGTAAARETPTRSVPHEGWENFYDENGNPRPGNPLEQAHRESTVTSESAGQTSVYGRYRAGTNKIFRDWVPMNNTAKSVLNGTTDSKIAKGLMGVSKWIGRIALPLTVLSSIGSVANAPSDQKMRAVGNAGGTILGGWAGAEAGVTAGALAGSLVGPIGTAVGAIIGGIAGGFGIGSLGGKVGGDFGSIFDPQKAEAATLDPSQQVSGQNAVTGSGQPLDQTDLQTTNLKYQSEVRRANNIDYEKENINRYVTILDRVTQLLTTARAQNGIIGNPNGAGGGTKPTIAGPGGVNPIQLGTGGTNTGGVGTVGASSNSGKLWNFYKGKGLSDGAVAGILGNLQQESGLDPTAVNKKSGAFGIGQWLGSRKKALFQYAKDNGKDVNSLDTQMQYLWKELSSGQYGDLSQMNGMTPEQAAIYFEKKFEKSGGSANDKRQGYAGGFFNQYHGTATQNAYNGGGYTMLSAKPTVNSTITVNVKPDQSVAEQVNNSKDMQNTAKYIQAAVYGGLNYYSKEMTRL
jgi:hypothetical protein